MDHPPGTSSPRPVTAGAGMPAAAAVTVLTVDDQPAFRRAARALVAATAGFEPVGEAASGAEALERVAELHPDLVLLDVRMPGMDGLETARRLAVAEPEAVVVLMSLDAIPAAAQTPPPGAAAFVRKQQLSPGLLRGLWEAHGRNSPPREGRTD